MVTINQIFKDYLPDYLEEFKDQLSLNRFKVANAIFRCGSGDFGYTKISCNDCHYSKTIENGCGNRHCPQCQQSKNQLWAERQSEMLIPDTSYFMVTFTLPKGIQYFFKKYPLVCYNSFFLVASETLKTFLKDEKHLGAYHPGFFGVLHTWDRKMRYHPHIHFIVPACGLSKNKSKLVKKENDYLMPALAASKVMRSKFYDSVKDTDLAVEYSKLPFKDRMKGWNIHCQYVGDGVNAVRYLSKYVFKVAISKERIVSVIDGKITFWYEKDEDKSDPNNKNKIRRYKTYSINKFIGMFLQHVLPTGFKKVRHYGFLHSKKSEIRKTILSKIKTEKAKDLLLELESPERKPEKKHDYTCSNCNSKNLSITVNRKSVDLKNQNYLKKVKTENPSERLTG